MIAALVQRAARATCREDGLTVVEVVVAGMILTVAGLGVLGMVDAATRNTFRVEQSQLVNNVLQREMEKIKATPYEDLGLTSLPTYQSGVNSPNSRVEGSAFRTSRNGAGAGKPLVTEGTVVPGPEPFQIEDVTGTIYRYVVWDLCPAGTCTDGDFLKRVVVVAKLDSTGPGGAERRYQELQSQIVDPEAEPTESPSPTPDDSPVTSWPLWLTDTTCDRSEPQTPAERLEVGPGFGLEGGDHPTHNTRGVCSNGLEIGNSPGAPDLLWPEAPILIEESESPIWDYATDVEPKVDPDRDKGLQIKLGNECGAMPATEIRSEPDPEPEATATMFQKLHKWITPPVNTANLAITGKGELSLWSQSIEHGVYPVTICVWLFVRENGTDTALTQTLESLPYTTYSQATWPSVGWTEVIVPLNFSPAVGGEIPLPQGSRVGLALSVKAGEKTSGIQILYDEPSFDSRLSLDTTGTLPGWP